MIRDHTFNPRGSSTGICHEFVLEMKVVSGHPCGRPAEDHQTIDPLEQSLLSFLQFLRKEYVLAEYSEGVESWDGEKETYRKMLTKVSTADGEIIEMYNRKLAGNL